MPAAAITVCNDAEQAAHIVQGEAAAGDVVLVKGSRAMGMERVLQQQNTEPLTLDLATSNIAPSATNY